MIFSLRPVRRSLYVALASFLVWMVAGAPRASAEVGLIVEGPTGGAGFFDDMGHAALWISRGCVDAHGVVYFCEGTPGVVIAGTGYWQRTGAAAIPAELYFLGSPNESRRAAWKADMASIYPKEPVANGQKYLGRLEGRKTRIDIFPTTPEQDRVAIAQLNRIRTSFHFRLIRENCSNFARSVLRLWLGPQFQVRMWANLSIVTPVAVEQALKQRLAQIPGEQLTTITFPNPKEWRWRRQARDVCGAVLFDPKYAVPMALLQPEAYAGFGGCYGLVKLKSKLAARHLQRVPAHTFALASIKQSKTAASAFAEMERTSGGAADTTAEVQPLPANEQDAWLAEPAH